METPLIHPPKFRQDVTVEVLDVMGDDAKIAFMARGSVGAGSSTAERDKGLIRRLMQDRHKVPFEHAAMTFRIECPIFVSRQLVKHRHSSISELSGRYSTFDGVFYEEPSDRPLGQVGKAMNYEMVHVDDETAAWWHTETRILTQELWFTYQEALERGIAREVARRVLPVGTYTELRVTLNLLSLMNVCSLRVDWGQHAAVPSHPQAEVQWVAEELSHAFAEHFPVTWSAFADNGYVI